MPHFLKPWRMALPTLGLIFLGVIWSVYWMWASSQAQTAVTKWRSELAAQGVAIHCGQESWGGYPFRVELSCTPGQIESDGRSVAFSELTVLAQAYDLSHILIVNDGETNLRSGERQMRVTHEGAIASLLLSKNGQAQLDVEFKVAAGENFTAERVAFHARLGPKNAARPLDLAAALETAAIITDSEPVAIDSFTISGNMAPLPEVIDFESLARTGAEITIGQMDLQSAAIRFGGKGRVKIGPDARPEGSLQGRIQNFDHVLQALADRGILEENARMGAGAVLGLLGGNSPDGMRIDIAAQQGGLYIGPFRIADLPPLF